MEGRNKIDALFSRVGTRVIDEQELARAGFSGKSFRNLNTLEEFEQAKQELKPGAKHL
jgi:molybdopterin-guanine dinucleotide biosynthesis protein A